MSSSMRLGMIRDGKELRELWHKLEVFALDVMKQLLVQYLKEQLKLP